MILSLLLFAGLLSAAGTLPVPPPGRVIPGVIEVGALYDGADIRIEGVAAPHVKVIVTVTGSEHEEAFNRKARFGPVWLNAGKVRISGAPSLFLRFGSGLTGRIPPGFDEASLMARMHVQPSSPGANAVLRRDYLALKKGDGIYSFSDGGVVLKEAGQQGSPFTLNFRWPKKAPPAEYSVHIYEIQDETVMRETSLPLSVVRVGFPAWLAGMAENRASLYGMTAILIGALAGFGIDFLTTSLFGKKRSLVH